MNSVWQRLDAKKARLDVLRPLRETSIRSLMSALDKQRNAQGVLSVVHADGIGQLPDSNAAEALAIINGPERFDLLFTDVVMPGGLNGRELAEQAMAMHPATASSADSPGVSTSRPWNWPSTARSTT